MKQHIHKKIDAIRSEGFITLLLSNLILALSVGLSGVWAFSIIYRYASNTTPGVTSRQNRLLVFGKQLLNGKPDGDYTQRLNRARALLNDQSADWVAILGGTTGKDIISEAAAGKNLLLEQGVSAKQILIEDKSRHTLENLQFAREMISKHAEHASGHAVVLISNRYHLARAHAMANGMRIKHELCAAEEGWNLSPRLCLKLLLEAYYLHWYYAGKYWSLWTNNKKWLRRIT
jgi:uncharacterized SAM-binding protein YcdF (DUF218 family)